MKSLDGIRYTSENCLEISRIGVARASSIIDFNLSVNPEFFHDTPPLGFRKSEFELISPNQYCLKSHELGMALKRHIKTYAVAGRQTIARHIMSFLSFQYKNKLELGTATGIDVWCHSMKSEVQQRAISELGAIAKLASVNKFLLHTNAINRQIKYTFSNRSNQRSVRDNGGYYTTSEHQKLMHYIMKMYDLYADEVSSMLIKIENGILPKYSLTQRNTTVYRPVEFKFESETYSYEVGLSALLTTFNQLAFVIFAYYTLGNKRQIDSLLTSEITQNKGQGFETSFLFKGRAFKWVRYGIGTSDVEMDRIGARWFSEFLIIRKRVEIHLSSINAWPKNFDKLFFSFNFNIGSATEVSNSWIRLHCHEHIWFLKDNGIEIPRVNISWLRKMGEQLIDLEGKDPILTTGKAQHEWETFQRSYAKGNPIDNLKKMSNALNILTKEAEATLSFEDRAKIAEQQGLHLVDENDSTYMQSIHGLGCKQSKEKTAIERRFFRKNQSRSYKPKLCVNILKCLECSKCGIIDNEENLYQTLSFRQAIMLNKQVYRGARIAESQYEEIVTKLNVALLLVDPVKLARAQKRINQEGLSEVWKITI